MKRYASMGLPSSALTALPITPREAFLLSRLEGECTEEDLSLVTGLDEGSVRLALELLVSLGAVRAVGGAAPAPVETATLPPPPMRWQVAEAPRREEAAPRAAASPAGLTGEERVFVEGLELRGRLGDHYTFLGVAAHAERRVIKDAYYELVARLHPDGFVGRDLASDGPRVARLLAAVEAAHEILANPARRARYDAERGGPVETASTPARTWSGDTIAGIPGSLPRTPGDAREDASAKDTGQTLARKLRSGHGAPHESGPGSRSGRTLEFGSGVALPSTSPDTLDGAPTSPRSAATAHAMAELRRRYEQLAPLARSEKLDQLLAQGDEALSAQRPVEAVQSYRLASMLAPDDPAVARALARAEALAAPEVAKNYTYFATRAEYADNTADACRFWAEAADRAPDDAGIQGRAAAALVRLDGDPAGALRCASRAVLLEPKRADYHALLGLAYLRQGMLRNAEREAHTAENLDASCTELSELRRELRSGGARGSST